MEPLFIIASHRHRCVLQFIWLGFYMTWYNATHDEMTGDASRCEREERVEMRK